MKRIHPLFLFRFILPDYSAPFVLSLFLLFLGTRCHADIIVLSRGQVIAGDILKQNDEEVLIKMDSGTLNFPMSSVKDIRLTSTDGAGHPLNLSETNRIQSWGKIVSALSKPAWSSDLHQIPATVIDNGALQNVPYVSFHCAGNCYELNIYGDLDNPACVEIGALKNLVNNERARSNCVEFIRSILTRYDDKRIAGSLGRGKQVITNDDFTFEITLPDEPDAYGGWWVSVYSESALESARASGNELLSISEPIVPAKPQNQASSATQVAPASVSVSAPSWSAFDLSQARPSSPSSLNSGGRVYVQGYYRKNGTYVNSYTRSYPRR